MSSGPEAAAGCRRLADAGGPCSPAAAAMTASPAAMDMSFCAAFCDWLRWDCTACSSCSTVATAALSLAGTGGSKGSSPGGSISCAWSSALDRPVCATW